MAALAALGLVAGAALAEPPAIGQPAAPGAIAGWNIDVLPDGTGLPDGKGTAREGAGIYAASCAACHGERGQGGSAYPGPRLVGGRGTLATAHPEKTVGSFWPYATTLFDYVRRAMPYSAPESLSADQLYGVVAYLLYLNGIVGEGTVLDRASLPRVRMPNRNGFIDAYGSEARGTWR
jgi:mono/diheme cytochrome c family protein